jgi:hypothetical protein
MPSRKPNRQKAEQWVPKAADAEVKVEPLKPDAFTRIWFGIPFQVAVFAVAFFIVVSRRPDAIMNAQFYAEDGWVWYPQAYQFGLPSFFTPEAGYVHALIRTVTLFSLLFPFSLAPLVMNISAIVVQILPVNVFLSSRFSRVPLWMRLLGSFVYLAIPNSQEIDANITNVQWHLALLACLVLLAQPPSNRRWRIFDAIVLVFTSFSSPIGILLIPAAAALWWKRRQPQSALSFGLLVPGAITELLVTLLGHQRPPALNGPSLCRFIRILGGQIYLSAMAGWRAQLVFLKQQDAIRLITAANDCPIDGLFYASLFAAAVGLTITIYALLYAPFEVKVFVLFCFSVLGLALARPLAGAPGNFPQWGYLCYPGRAGRYYFFPMLAFFASLAWAATNRASPAVIRYVVILPLILLPYGIQQDWQYDAFQDLHFPSYAEKFEHASAGTTLTIPINPRSTMKITKR